MYIPECRCQRECTEERREEEEWCHASPVLRRFLGPSIIVWGYAFFSEFSNLYKVIYLFKGRVILSFHSIIRDLLCPFFQMLEISDAKFKD